MIHGQYYNFLVHKFMTNIIVLDQSLQILLFFRIILMFNFSFFMILVMISFFFKNKHLVIITCC